MATVRNAARNRLVFGLGSIAFALAAFAATPARAAFHLWKIDEGYEGYFGGYNFRMNAMAQNAMQAAPGGAGEGDETLPLGQIAVRAQVNVTFDLTDK